MAETGLAKRTIGIGVETCSPESIEDFASALQAVFCKEIVMFMNAFACPTLDPSAVRSHELPFEAHGIPEFDPFKLLAALLRGFS